ncbi:ketoacyl-synt-domain-containing protein [Arthroderma uncinatum]|uniref:ketoacyl-synt-domain-containing protein n=1 Tax=Arthroderma uncinatum TaxID=74035 RepID=UPI00144AA339|nr:ketoacyl-synt-domain-containing protein [Arthroderma uncinatum]KAF3490695.1 ketoacyl-synt-domain-containing protein [Arthroderma uncinatum]
MNDCGVVRSSIHGDIVYTLGEYLYKKLVPNAKTVHVDITDLKVTKGLVAQRNTNGPQYFRVTATTTNINTGVADFVWENVANDGSVSQPFATCRILYGDANAWLSAWSPLAHLVHGRIDALERLAAEGIASRFSHKMVYTLFGNNLVKYADKYRDMQAVERSEFEAFADVTLKHVHGGGNYNVPPFSIDSVAHLAGFIMNVSDASDTANTFCMTPGWDIMRFVRPLVAGHKYRSYVKMIPTDDDPSVYLGDVNVFQDGVIIGIVAGIQFRRYPRILMNRFFAAPDSSIVKSYTSTVPTSTPAA